MPVQAENSPPSSAARKLFSGAELRAKQQKISRKKIRGVVNLFRGVEKNSDMFHPFHLPVKNVPGSVEELSEDAGEDTFYRCSEERR